MLWELSSQMVNVGDDLDKIYDWHFQINEEKNKLITQAAIKVLASVQEKVKKMPPGKKREIRNFIIT